MSAESIVPRLLTVQQAAAYLSTSVHAVRQLQWGREIPSLKIGKRLLFDKKDLDRYVDLAKAGA
jgi:excisionase family DNA binding protein